MSLVETVVCYFAISRILKWIFAIMLVVCVVGPFMVPVRIDVPSGECKDTKLEEGGIE